MASWSKRVIIPEPKHNPVTHKYTYDELYAEYWEKLHRQFSMSIDDWHLAEDLTQEVMLRVLKFWDRIQWDKLTGAIGTIANNVRYDYLNERTNKVDKDSYDDMFEFEQHDEGITDPVRLLVTEQAIKGVDGFLKSLKDKDKDVFVDFYLNNMEITEVCDKHNMKRNHVYVQLFRIRELLNDEFRKMDIIPDGGWNAVHSY